MPVNELDILKAIILKEAETETLPQGFEDDPMGFILKKYPGLNEVMEYMMTDSFRDYVDAIFIVAPKPTTFKILLHNGQFFFLQFMGKAYQATVAGKNYYLMSIGEKERCMLAIARLLRYGNPMKTKGPEGAEQGTRPEGEEGGAGGEAGGGETAAAPEAGGEEAAEETPVTESMILETILKKSLFEVKGLIFRKEGDQFSDGQKTLSFVASKVYPENKTKFDSVEERDSEIEKIEKESGSKIQFINDAGKKLSFATVELKGDQGEKVYWGKYFPEKSSSMMGKWPNKETPGNFRLQTASSKKYQSNLSPQDLIGTDKPFSTTQEVIDEISTKNNPLQDELVSALKDLDKGNLPMFRGQAENIPAIRDNFGEIMAPIALRNGLVTGDAKAAEKTLLDGDSWESCKMSWVMSKNEGLIDSKMISPKGIEVGISSKGEKGAEGSAKNVWPAIEKSSEEIKSQYSKAVEIIEIIKQNTAIDQVFKLAEKVGVSVSSDLQKEIKGYISSGKSDLSGISKEAEELYKKGAVREKTPGFNTGKALLSILAKLVAKAVNESTDIQFSKAVKTFMNQATVIQINCSVLRLGKNAKVAGFKAIYPPKFEGNATLSASKNYASTIIKGGMSVKFS